MLSLQEIQHEVGQWAWEEFGNNVSADPSGVHFGHPLGSLAPLLGMMGELGELAQAVVKCVQDRKYNGPGGASALREAKKDALADLLIFACDYACRESIDLTTVLDQVWAKVRLRTKANYEADKRRLDQRGDQDQQGDGDSARHPAEDRHAPGIFDGVAPDQLAAGDRYGPSSLRGAYPPSVAEEVTRMVRPNPAADPSHKWKDPAAAQTRCVYCGAYRHLSSGMFPCPAAGKVVTVDERGVVSDPDAPGVETPGVDAPHPDAPSGDGVRDGGRPGDRSGA